jgi:hypothetical protein
MAQSLTDFVANLKRITELDVSDGNNPNDEMFTIMASSISDYVEAGDQTDEIIKIIENNQEEVINIIGGINSEVDDLREETNNAIDDILAMRDFIDGEFKPQLNLEVLSRKESDRALFDTAASLAEFRRKTSEFENDITNAVFEVNPENGTINLKAYSYTDTQFTQAGILINGVDAKVSINAGKIVDLGNSVQDANSSIEVLAGQVEIKASYTEMTEYVSGALDAVIPAYSFGFFNSSEGWSAVNGAITQGNSKILTTWGDIENQTLSYSADDNPVITLTVARTSGVGYTGDLIVFFDDNSAETYTGVIEDIPLDGTSVKILNLAEEASYTGTVTGLRLILGGSVSDEFEIQSITIGKPSAQLEALDGITAQVNQLGIDVNAIEGQLTSFVTTTFYDENSVTLNNVTQVLDGEEAIISLKATQNVLNEQGTIGKANTASFWVDAAEANITTTLTSFNAQEGGIDDQLEGLNGSINTINQELSTIDGASIRTQLLSINRLQIESGDLEEAQFYTELKLLDQRNRDLTLGDSIATIDTQTKTLANDSQALAQQITELSASIGTIEGQVDANATFILNTDAKADGTAQSLAALETEVVNTQGEVSDAQLLLDSTVDELGVVSSRAYLGVSNTVDGKTIVTGITADSSTNGLRFQGDVVQFDDSAGNPALQYRADLNKWVFTGNVVVGGYTVESEDDIRALDGDTIYEVYQYSVDGSTNWHDDYTTGDIFRRTATVTNGVRSSWRDLSRITGATPEIINNPDGSYTITNGTETATIFDGEDAPIPTATDNGDGTYTITDGAGNSVTVSNGEKGYTPIKGIDYFDGLDGSFVSNVYKTSSTGTPPLPTGGTFNGTTETFPSGWRDTPYFAEGAITYISTTKYSQQSNGSWVKSGWSAPAEYIIKGDEGPQGVAGQDGEDGTTYYTWIRYADTSSGGGISNSPTNKEYIGFAYNQASPIELNDPNLYTWSLIKGTDGVKGDTGEDGTTYYTWIAYSDFADGTDLYQEPNENTLYIGIAPNRLTPTESDVKGDYTWSRFKGDDGEAGKDAESIVATLNYDFTNGLSGWDLVDMTWEQKATYIELTTQDSTTQIIRGGLSVDGSKDSIISMRVRNKGETFSTNAQIFYVTSSHGWQEAYKKLISPVTLPQNEWVTINFDMRELTNGGDDWITSTISGLRIDFPRGRGIRTFDLDYIAVGRVGAAEDGATGAGFYGSTYTAISWTTSTANSLFSALVGRDPVSGDIFTQTRVDGTDSQARQFNGSSWVTVALQVNGSIVAKGTVAGDRLIAGTEISAPVIKGAKIESVGTSYMKVISGEPFGPDNLIEWYGLKAGNISGNNPIYANLRKNNAITYVDDEGSPYFGGVFKAGVLENSGSTSLKTQTPEREVSFTSNGGPLNVAVSFSFSSSFVGPTSGDPSSVVCPVTPTMNVVTGTVFLENWNGSSWVILTQQPITGSYNCTDGEYNGETGGAANQAYFSSTNSSSVFTFTDTTGGTNRTLRVRAVLQDWFFSNNSSQILSIVSSE